MAASGVGFLTKYHTSPDGKTQKYVFFVPVPVHDPRSSDFRSSKLTLSTLATDVAFCVTANGCTVQICSEGMSGFRRVSISSLSGYPQLGEA